MKQNKIHRKDLSIKNEVKFCAECGEDLSEFGLKGNINKKKVYERHKKCKETGKFNGDMCSMRFISDDADPLPLSDELE